jgi:hypothetical protein
MILNGQNAMLSGDQFVPISSTFILRETKDQGETVIEGYDSLAVFADSQPGSRNLDVWFV